MFVNTVPRPPVLALRSSTSISGIRSLAFRCRAETTSVQNEILLSRSEGMGLEERIDLKQRSQNES